MFSLCKMNWQNTDSIIFQALGEIVINLNFWHENIGKC